MSHAKWEYKIVDHSNSTSMGYSNPETEDFKQSCNDKDWKLKMMNIAINKLGEDGWEMVGLASSDAIYFKRKVEK